MTEVHSPLIAALLAAALGCLVAALVVARRGCHTPVCSGLVATLGSAAVWSGATAALHLAVDWHLLSALMLVTSYGAAVALVYLSRALTDPAWHPSPLTAWTAWALPQLLLLALVFSGNLDLAPGSRGGAGVHVSAESAGSLSWGRLPVALLLALALGRLVVARHGQALRARRDLTTLMSVTTLAALTAAATGLVPDALSGVDYAPLAFGLAALIHADVLLRNGLVSITSPRADQILQRLSDAVVVVDAAGRLTGMNPAGQRLARPYVAAHSGTLMGVPAWEVLQSSVAAAAHAPQGTTRSLVLPSGERLEARVDVLIDPRGRRFGAVVACREVTEHASARAKIEAAYASLAEEYAYLEDVNARLVEELCLTEQARTQLAEDVIRDPLTGVHNRRRLEPAVGAGIRQAQLSGRTVAVLVVDVDHFKKVNDTHGHAVGDRVLQSLAHELVRTGRPGETAVRYGGEEFVIVIPEVLPYEALRRAEEIRRTVSALQMPLRREAVEPDLSVTVSVGMSTYPEHGKTARELIMAADRALYAAKEAGRDCVVSA